MGIFRYSLSFVINFLVFWTNVTAGKSGRLTGGQDASPGQFPWVVSINVTQDVSTFAVGVLLSNRWILTAAHPLTSAEEYFVTLGAYDLTSPNSQLTFQLDQFHVRFFPGYDSTTTPQTGDLALVELDVPVDSSVPTLRLADFSDTLKSFVGQNLTGVGWGIPTDPNFPLVDVLQWISNPVISNADCQTAYGSTAHIKNSNICMSVVGGQSECQLDDGGPMTFVDTDGNPTLIGIYSYGGCDKGLPSVATRVDSAFTWIWQTTGIQIGG